MGVGAGAVVETKRTEQPTGLPTIPASVGVPLLRALVFLAFDGIAASAVAGVLKKAALPVVHAGVGDWLVSAVVNAVHPLSIGAIAGVMSARFHWQKELAESNAVLWRIEEVTRRDLDGDGHVGPPPAVQPVREFFTPTGKVAKGEYISRKIPWISWAEGNAVAIAVLHSGVPFSRRKLTDAGALPDDPEHYTDLFNAMIAAAYLTPHGNGGKLTDLGRWYLAQFLPPPLRRNVT